jgi:CubicO group peptidase (beta-lactamase class C family)
MSIIIALLFLAIGASAAEPLERALDTLAAETMSAWRVPGLAIAVVQNDRVVYMKGFGVKELGKTDPVTPDTLFEIASTTKAFTTTAMAMLVDQKKIAWDDPVRKYVEYFHLGDSRADSLVTLRDIVSHRTGLSRHDELWDYTDWPRERIIRSVASVKLSRPFRSAYQYQNIMFALAGEVVASAAKTTWEEFVKTKIFEPLGMTHTRIAFADWKTSQHATGHRFEAAADRVSVQPMVDYGPIAPAGQIKSSVHDMAQWVRFQLAGGAIDGKRLIPAEALGETHLPQTMIRIEGLGKEATPETNLQAYGLGWVVQDYRGQVLISHGGSINGFRTQVALLPKQNAGLVVLSNLSRSLAVAALRNNMIDRLIGGPRRDWNQLLLDVDRKSVIQDETKKREREAKRRADTKPSRELQSYAGTYENSGYGQAAVAIENGGLVLRWNRLSVPLTHFHFDTFSASIPEDDFDEQVQFQLGADGEVKTMTLFGEEFLRNPSS